MQAGKVNRLPPQCQTCHNFGDIYNHPVLQRKSYQLNNDVLAEISAALERVGDQALCVAGIVRSALGNVLNLRDRNKMRQLVNTYGHMVRIHLRLFNLIYDAEMKTIMTIVDVPESVKAVQELEDGGEFVEELQDDYLVHYPPSPPVPPPAKRTRLRGDRACIAESEEYIRGLGSRRRPM